MKSADLSANLPLKIPQNFDFFFLRNIRSPELCTAGLHQAMLFICCVQDYQEHILLLLALAQSPAMITLLLTVLHSKSMPSPGPIIHKMKLIIFFITCAYKPKDFMVTIVSNTVLLPRLKNERSNSLGYGCTVKFNPPDQNSLQNYKFFLYT